MSDSGAPALTESFASPLGSGERHPRRHPARNLIDGSWVAAATGGTYERRNPAAPTQLIGPIPDSGRPDVEAAARAAHAAFTGWAERPGAERAAILDAAARLAHQRAEELARAISHETGKPLREARAEATRVATTLRYFAADAWLPRGELYAQSATTGQVYTLRRPLGVVGLIPPWNFPAAIPAWKAAPALAAGNTVVLKPSEDAPLSAIHLARCLTDAGLPPDVLNVVIGRGPAAGAALVAQVRAVSFTGSVAVGRRIRDEATARGKQLEMGGHNSLIVMSDADLDRAVAAAYAGAFLAAGQKCTATRRIFLQEQIYDEFRERLLARMRQAVIGDPSDPRTGDRAAPQRASVQRCPAGHRASASRGRGAARWRRLQRPSGLLRGANALRGPRRPSRPGTPRDVRSGRLAVPLHEPRRGVGARERRRVRALGRHLHHQPRDAQRFVTAAQAGVIHVNSTTTGADVHVPFGGIKASG